MKSESPTTTNRPEAGFSAAFPSGSSGSGADSGSDAAARLTASVSGPRLCSGAGPCRSASSSKRVSPQLSASEENRSRTEAPAGALAARSTLRAKGKILSAFEKLSTIG